MSELINCARPGTQSSYFWRAADRLSGSLESVWEKAQQQNRRPRHTSDRLLKSLLPSFHWILRGIVAWSWLFQYVDEIKANDARCYGATSCYSVRSTCLSLSCGALHTSRHICIFIDHRPQSQTLVSCSSSSSSSSSSVYSSYEALPDVLHN